MPFSPKATSLRPQLANFKGLLRGHVCLAKGASVELVNEASPRIEHRAPPVGLEPLRLSDLPETGHVDLVGQVLKVQADSAVFVWDGNVRAHLLTVYVLHPNASLL